MAAPASVEAYLAALPEASRAALEGLREMIRAAAPDATEAISYGMPAFKIGDRLLVSYAAFKSHVSVFPASGVVLEVLGQELRPYVTGKATIRFEAGVPIPTELVTAVVKVRHGEITARSDR